MITDWLLEVLRRLQGLAHDNLSISAMTKRRLASLSITAALLCVAVSPSATAQVPFTIQGPGFNPDDFRITEFATGLNYPVGMVSLDDGSILAAVSNGLSFFGSSSGSIVRLADTDGDGVADSSDTLVSDVPGGKLSALRRSGDLIFTTGQGSGAPISIYRLGAQPNDPLSFQGSMTINYSGNWLHPHSALAARQTPGVPGSHDLFFQLGSRTNFDDTTATRPLTSTIGSSGSLAGDAIHMIRITDNGSSVSGADPVQIATGLRNAAGMDFHPETGDLYLQDNGIDGVVVAIEPTSADELNVIAAADIGGAIEDFGFPQTYEEYRTGTKIGNTGIDPLVAFQPIPPPNGAEAEGANDIAFAPAGFPEALRNGIFVGMHGQFSGGGLSNEENPLVFVDLDDNSYFHFIGNDEAGVGHLDGLLSTNDSLFVADISPGGGLGSGDRNTGKIYQIQAIATPTPGDFDGDGDVDGDDLVQWTGDYSKNGNSDADGDGDSDGLDFLTWQQNYSGTVGTTSHASVVPEPSLGALIAMLSVALVASRKTGKVMAWPQASVDDCRDTDKDV